MAVTLRIFDLKGSMRSLVLDYVPSVANPKTGKLQRFRRLKLYLYKDPQTFLEKNHNKETLLQAQTICAKRQLESQNRRFGLISEEDRNANFIDFCRSVPFYLSLLCYAFESGSEFAKPIKTCL